MINIYKTNSLKLLIISFLFIIGCHNNAHIRTQKILKPEQKVYSFSGIIPLGGIDEQYQIENFNGNNIGVAGLRCELSMLKGLGTYEFGPYLGVGANFNDEEFGLILGLDYRGYSDFKRNNPKKIGSKFEFNFSPNGYVFTLNPNSTTATTKIRSSYYGFHGLLTNGNLYSKQYFDARSSETDGSHHYFSHGDSLYYFEVEQKYNYYFTSVGGGFTYGYEFFNSKKHSFQIQLDFSLIKNNFKDLKLIDSFNTNLKDLEVDVEYIGEWKNYSEPFKNYESDPVFIVSLSAGMNFFKPDLKDSTVFKPMPIPNKNINQSIYNPETGELITTKSLKFDPNTGTPTPSVPPVEIIKDYASDTDLKSLDKDKASDYKDNDIRNEAKLLANSNHNKNLHNIIGLGSCVAAPFWGISLLTAVIYRKSNILSTFDTNNPYYESLDSSQKIIFESAYKIEERKLRTKNITYAQKSCFGLWVGSIFFLMIIEN